MAKKRRPGHGQQDIFGGAVNRPPRKRAAKRAAKKAAASGVYSVRSQYRAGGASASRYLAGKRSAGFKSHPLTPPKVRSVRAASVARHIAARRSVPHTVTRVRQPPNSRRRVAMSGQLAFFAKQAAGHYAEYNSTKARLGRGRAKTGAAVKAFAKDWSAKEGRKAYKHPYRTYGAKKLGIGGASAAAGVGLAAYAAKRKFRKTKLGKKLEKHPGVTRGATQHKGSLQTKFRGRDIDIGYNITKPARHYAYRGGKIQRQTASKGKKGGPHHATRQRRDRRGRFA